MFHFGFNEGNGLSYLERDCTTNKQRTNNNSNRKGKKDILRLLILNAIKFYFHSSTLATARNSMQGSFEMR